MRIFDYKLNAKTPTKTARPNQQEKGGILRKWLGASAASLALLSGSIGCNSDIETQPKQSNTIQIIESNDSSNNNQSESFINDSIFELIDKAKMKFPSFPNNIDRAPSLKILKNTSNGSKAFVIEEVHNSRITHDILANVLANLANQNLKETLFILEGIKPSELKTYNDQNSEHPNEICCHIANQSGANVVNPIANISQWSLVSEVLKEAQKAGYKREEALDYIVTSLVFGSPSELQIDHIRATEDLKTKWGTDANIQEMYESADKALDATPDAIEKFSKKINFEDISNWTKISQLIKKNPSEKQRIIGFAVCCYAAETFGHGKYPDALKSFKKMQKLWGPEAPTIEELHRSLHIGMNSGFDENTKIGDILFSQQDKASREGIIQALKKFNPKNIVVIAGFNHSPGVIQGLEASGFTQEP